MPTTTYLLTGDIGGNNSLISLYNIHDTIPLFVVQYSNHDNIKTTEAGVFENSIIAPFLKECWEKNANLEQNLDNVQIIACLAIAGPVRNNAVFMSNSNNIVVNGTEIAAQTNNKSNDPYLKLIKVCKIINDFVAQGYGCLTLQPNEVKELIPGKKGTGWNDMDPTGPKVCVGAGIGLGECFLTPDVQGNYTCFASEGGHVEFAPRDEIQIKMFNYLKQKFGSTTRISVERVVSGKGLANCYEFLAQEFPDCVDPKVHEAFLNAGMMMQGREVAVNATPGSLCLQAIEIMMSAYGSEVGASAVKFIPTGGLFVTGGLTPKLIQRIEGKDSPFMKAYIDKGRVTPILDGVPVFAVMTEDLGVRGAHKCAQIEFVRYLEGKGSAAPKTSSTTNPKKPSSMEIFILATYALAAATGAYFGMNLAKRK